MYKTILVPLDTSPHAEAILPHVEEMAHLYTAKVVFLMVDEPPLMLGRDEVIDINLYRTKLKKRKDQIESYFAEKEKEFGEKGIETKFCLEYGSVVKTVLDVAAREQADIVAMASHGIASLTGTSHGSVAAGVMQKTNRPLLITRFLNAS